MPDDEVAGRVRRSKPARFRSTLPYVLVKISSSSFASCREAAIGTRSDAFFAFCTEDAPPIRSAADSAESLSSSGFSSVYSRCIWNTRWKIRKKKAIQPNLRQTGSAEHPLCRKQKKHPTACRWQLPCRRQRSWKKSLRGHTAKWSGSAPVSSGGHVRPPRHPASGIPNTVSYTHLDVYKRQVSTSSTCRNL